MIIKLLMLTAALLLPSLAAAQDRFENPDRLVKLRTAFPEIDRMMREFSEQRRAPGTAWAIIIDGSLAHAGTYGVRDVDSSAPVDTATVFRIASMTKSFTAAAILQLRDAGRLQLDDPAEKYVPELAALRYPTTDAPKITVRHLLTHSAGFPEDNPWGDQQLAISDDEMTRLLEQGLPFSTSPATDFEYSNYGFAILGRIIRNVSGMPYDRYITERVLRPLGMSAATLNARSVPAQHLARGYRLQQDGSLREEPPLPHGAFGSMGGMLMPVTDLARWVGFMLDAWPARDAPDSGPLRRASRREMQQAWRYTGAMAVFDTATHTLSMGAGGYGYGLGLRQTCRFDAVVSHSGGLPGFGSVMKWLPAYGVGVVALGNRTYIGWGGIVDRAIAALDETGGLVRRVPQPAPVLLLRQEQVSRLVNRWDDALADSMAAMNLYRDESKAIRRAAIEAQRTQVGGSCTSDQVEAENALRGTWRMRCANGDLQVTITLAPTQPAQVQYLNVQRVASGESLALPPTCRP